jgi:ferric-dicitrate binding protein FerR (iron transport regulator)
MTPEERDRLARLEAKNEAFQDEMRRELADIRADQKATRKEIGELSKNWAKAGGVMIALTAIGAVIGWATTNIKAWMGAGP